MTICSFCSGTGISPGSEQFGGVECEACGGTGEERPPPFISGPPVLQVPDHPKAVEEDETAEIGIEPSRYWRDNDRLRDLFTVIIVKLSAAVRKLFGALTHIADGKSHLILDR